MKFASLALALLVVACGGPATPSLDATLPFEEFKAHVEAAELPTDTASELGWLIGAAPERCYADAHAAYQEAIELMDDASTEAYFASAPPVDGFVDLPAILALSDC